MRQKQSTPNWLDRPMRFHWRLPQGGESDQTTNANQNDTNATALPDIEHQIAFCRKAEEMGIHSLLVDINYGKPDPILLSTALAAQTESIHFLIAVRSGLLSPTLLVQQINTLSGLSNGRVALNVVVGHSPAEQRYYGDHLPHDQRYVRTTEFLEVCDRFWDRNGPVDFEGEHFRVADGKLNTGFFAPDRDRPFVFVAGGSAPAPILAHSHGDCWMQLADTPKNLAPKTRPIAEKGTPCGMRLSLITRETREEALDAAQALLDGVAPGENRRQEQFVRESDSLSVRESHALGNADWPSPHLWSGAAQSRGPTSISIVGSYADAADKFLEYKRAGVSEFIISGWPKQAEMERFGQQVLPIIREHEAQALTITTTTSTGNG